MYTVLDVQMVFVLKNIFWNETRKKQTDGRLYSLLLSLPYRYHKLRLTEMRICFQRLQSHIRGKDPSFPQRKEKSRPDTDTLGQVLMLQYQIHKRLISLKEIHVIDTRQILISLLIKLKRVPPFQQQLFTAPTWLEDNAECSTFF